MSAGTRRVPRCLLALSATGLGLLLMVLGLLLPWLEQNSDYDRQILLRNRQLTGYERQIATLPALQQELVAMASNQSMAAYYVDAPDASLGGVALQRLIEQLTGESGGTMTSIQILPAQQEGRLMRIGVRLRLQVTADGLQRVLYGIEAREPLLFVDKLNVRSMYRAKRQGREPANQGVQLNVNLDVFGYVRGEAG